MKIRNIIYFFNNVYSAKPEDYNLPHDYTFSKNSWGNSFYKTYTTKLNYEDAKSQCESDGSFLALPRSVEENKFLSRLGETFLGETYMTGLWIGINDIEQEGIFVGPDGHEISWTNWGYGEPNGGHIWDGQEQDEDGAKMAGGNSLYTGMAWYDVKLSELYPFICWFNIEGKIFTSELNDSVKPHLRDPRFN